MFPPNVNRPSQCHLLYMLNSLWDPRAPIWSFFFLFLFCIKQVLPRACSQGRKKRVILNKMKQTGKAEQSTYEEQRLKNSPDKNHTKHSSHLISCYMHWGSQEHQAPRQQSSEVLTQAPPMWQIHAHTPAHTRPRQKYTCMHRWQRTTGRVVGERGLVKNMLSTGNWGPREPFCAG